MQQLIGAQSVIADRAHQAMRRWRKHERRFAKYRRTYWEQEGRCFYCGEVMWTGWMRSEVGSPLRVTQEHLFTRKQMAERIAHGNPRVAACASCNHVRGARPWQEFMVSALEERWRGGLPVGDGRSAIIAWWALNEDSD